MKNWIYLLILSLSLPAFAEFDCENLKSTLHNGDMVFIDVDSFVFHEVAVATHTWASHVGMAMQIDGEWKIMESRVPFAAESDLCNFVQHRSKNQYYAVRRFPNPLSDEQVQALRAAAERRLGLPYNIGFDYDSWGVYCSKFVFDTYKEALGIEVGEIETFGDLIAKYPNDSTTFWKIWFLGKIPTERRTVTPASIYFNPNLVTVEQQVP